MSDHNQATKSTPSSKDPTTAFKQYRRILTYLRSYTKQFLLALVCMVAYGASDGVLPFIVKYVLERVFTDKNPDLLYFFPVGLVILSIVRGAADFGQQFLMARIGHFIVRDTRNQMASKVIELGPAFFLRNSTGDILSRVQSDVHLMRALLTDTVSALLRDSIRITVLLATAVYLDPTLAMIALVALPLGAVPIIRFGKTIRGLSKHGQETIGEVGSLLNEVILGSKVVKIFGSEEFEKGRFCKKNELLTNTLVKSELFRAIAGPVNEILASLGIAGVLLYGGLSVVNGTRTEGDFIAFLMATFLMYDPFKKISRISSTVFQGLAGAQRVFDLLDTVNPIVSPQDPKSLPKIGEIQFDQVSLSYPESERFALKDINLKIEAGERIAVVGFSGAGKSTLVDLIPRFIDPTVGKVTIGGVDLRDVAISDLRNQITMVSQHTFLFNDTILNNIRYGVPSASLKEIEKAAENAYALEIIEQLPNKYETIIGEGGYSLSGGERQRIAIARAMLRNAPILILDEATAALDNKAERMVQAALRKLEENRTSIIIAHRLSTIQDVDRIVVLKDGRIVEVGSHEELLNLNGEYFQLHSLQFGKQNF